MIILYKIAVAEEHVAQRCSITEREDKDTEKERGLNLSHLDCVN